MKIQKPNFAPITLTLENFDEALAMSNALYSLTTDPRKDYWGEDMRSLAESMHDKLTDAQYPNLRSAPQNNVKQITPSVVYANPKIKDEHANVPIEDWLQNMKCSLNDPEYLRYCIERIQVKANEIAQIANEIGEVEICNRIEHKLLTCEGA